MRANPDLPLDVVGVGNAIVDVIATVPDDFLSEHGLVKGAMTLIDTERATSLYAAMPPGIEASGGSAANTMAGVASLGGRATYIGKVRDDQSAGAPSPNEIPFRSSSRHTPRCCGSQMYLCSCTWKRTSNPSSMIHSQSSTFSNTPNTGDISTGQRSVMPCSAMMCLAHS